MRITMLGDGYSIVAITFFHGFIDGAAIMTAKSHFQRPKKAISLHLLTLMQSG